MNHPVMKISKGKPDPGGRQLPVRFSQEDNAILAELQQHLEQDAATIIRWAVKHYRQVVEAHHWNVNSRGEPLVIAPPVKR